MTALALETTTSPTVDSRAVPLTRIIRVELRKMFDTRSGFWLMASVLIAAVVSTIATILFAPDADLTYYTFAKAIGFPMTVILPIIAVLSITGEWSQRSGLTTFTLVAHRNRVIAAKAIASFAVGVSAMLIALVVGVVGNIVGPAVTGTGRVWDVSFAHGIYIVVGSLLCLLTGTMLGILFRSTPVALVAYFVYALLLPTVLGLLASAQAQFQDLRPWVDLNLGESFLFEGTISGQEWWQLATSVTLWIVLPALLGLTWLRSSEVR